MIIRVITWRALVIALVLTTWCLHDNILLKKLLLLLLLLWSAFILPLLIQKLKAFLVGLLGGALSHGVLNVDSSLLATALHELTIGSLSATVLKIYDLLVTLYIRLLLTVSLFHTTHGLGELDWVVRLVVHVVALHHLVLLHLRVLIMGHIILVGILGSPNVLDLDVNVSVDKARL